MQHTITISVSIRPVSANDASGGTVNVRIPRVDPDSGWARTRDELHHAAVARACERLFGRGTFWWGDSGLPGYGQVMRPCKSGGSTAVTYRAGLDVEIPDLGDEHLAALQQRAAEDARYAADCEAEYRAGYAAYAPGRLLPYDYKYDFCRGWRDAQANAYFAAELAAERPES